MPWRILITARTFERSGQSALEILRAAGCTVVCRFGPWTERELVELLPGFDAVLATGDAYTGAVLESDAASRLKLISRWGVGYDTVDVTVATRQGIVVAYTPNVLDDAVADYTWALLLSAARRVPEVHESMRAGRWSAAWGFDVTGKTLGIVGCGRIGVAVARRAAGFRMCLLGYDCAPSATAIEAGIQFVALEELLERSDFVSLHAALTPASQGLMGKSQLKRMKPTAWLINTGRGPLVDERALAQALDQGWIAGAALDVFAQEPLPLDSPLRAVPNVVLSPHQSSLACDTGARVSQTTAQAALDLIHGRRPAWVVNPEVFDSPKLRTPILPSPLEARPAEVPPASP